MHVIAVGKEQYLLNIAEEIMNKEALTALFEKYVRKLRITPAWDVRLEFVEDPVIVDRVVRRITKKFIEDDAYFQQELLEAGDRTLVFARKPEYMTGKTVNER